MANPVLNEKRFAVEQVRTIEPSAYDTTLGAPAWRETLTIDGVVSRCLVLFPILVAAAWLGWQTVDGATAQTALPGWLLAASLGAFGVALLTAFRPNAAPYTAPLYAAVEGLVLGAWSAFFEVRYEGIVVQALGLTASLFVVMLALYSKRIVVVTDRLRRGIVAATVAVLVLYVVNLLLRVVVGASLPFLHESSPLGILFSLVVLGIASFNLLLDFDLIERGVGRAPKRMEWFAAFGLLVTLVWIYIEALRLLAKLRDR